MTCPLLRSGRCSVYEVRPLICRLWGVAEGMPCLWGCIPDRMLTKEEAAEFVERVSAIGGPTVALPE